MLENRRHTSPNDSRIPTSIKEGEASTLGLPQFFLQSQNFFAFTPDYFSLIDIIYVKKRGIIFIMEDTQKKKISNFMWWLALIVIICWLISNSPIILFELAILGGIWLYLSKSSRKSADINEKEEVVEEKEPDFVVAGEKTDSFYSGISENSSINGKDK